MIETTPGAGGAAGPAEPTQTAFWIPEMLSWEDTGVTAPIHKGPVWRIGASLYQFGGYTGAADTAKIYSAPYDDTGDVPVFTYTGKDMPLADGTCQGARVCLIDDTLWMLGSQTGSVVLATADIADPTTWTNLGTIPRRRDNCGFVLTNGSILLMHGYDGVSAGRNTFDYASTSDPTSWSQSGAIGGARWEPASAVVGNRVLLLGGFNTNTAVLVMPVGPSFTPGNSFGAMSSTGTTLTSAVEKAPDVFDVAGRLWLPGFNNSARIQSVAIDNPIEPWVTTDGGMPTNISYPYGASWIGGDGRAYVISTVNRHILRSGRRKVYVPDAQIIASAPYAGLAGVADGQAVTVSSQIRMGNRPWLVERATTY